MKTKEQTLLIELEEAYRRGFAHGFLSAKSNPDKEREVLDWYREEIKDISAPPGSAMEGTIFKTLDNEDNNPRTTDSKKEAKIQQKRDL